MAIYRARYWLIIWALTLFLTGTALGVDVPFNPLPTGIGRATRFQPWSGNGISPYTGTKHAATGYFFSADSLFWWNRGPKYHDVGDDEMGKAPPIEADGSYFRPGMNSVNTGMLDMVRGTGGRFEFGYSADNWGWVSSILSMNGFTSSFTRSDAEILFVDSKTPMQYYPGVGYLGDGVVVFAPFTLTQNVGFLDGFVSQSVGGSPIDDNQNNNIILGRFKPNASDVYDPTDIDSQLQPQQYDLGDLVRLATTFRTLKVTLRSDIRAFELMPYYRTNILHKGGYVDLMLGGRFFRYNEKFSIQGYGEPRLTAAGYTSSVLSEMYSLTSTQNNLVGPQVGARWFRESNRLQLSAEGRFMAAYNLQNINQISHLETPQQPNENGGQFASSKDPRQLGARGPNTLLSFTPRTANYTIHNSVFSPLLELRGNVGFRLTEWAVVRAGWTGIWASGIARPSSMVNYVLPAMGIRNRNREDIFVQGLNLGIEFNR